ncbi:hypothetical protein SAMN05518847_106192 [Paenibacillus sp. OV219]|nr:hypothetical protein SAMN05518847_106192 [Paenibacillus sp. OV219]
MLCPICNGLEQLYALCPVCSLQTEDCGRLDDFTGPYAPYQPDTITNSETIPSLSFIGNNCSHVVYCPSCSATYEVQISEWP